MNHCRNACIYAVEAVYDDIARCFTPTPHWSGVYKGGGCLHFLVDPNMWEGAILEVDPVYGSGVLATQDVLEVQIGHAWSCMAEVVHT